jgi:hypothetical protein
MTAGRINITPDIENALADYVEATLIARELFGQVQSHRGHGDDTRHKKWRAAMQAEHQKKLRLDCALGIGGSTLAIFGENAAYVPDPNRDPVTIIRSKP